MRPDPVTAEEISAFASRLVSGGLANEDVDRVDALRALEELKCVAEGRQVRETAALDVSQRRAAAEAGVPPERQGRGIGHQVARAWWESPHMGQRHVGLARALDREMPCTRAALVTARITEWRATVLARETACLPLEHRQPSMSGWPRMRPGSRAWGTASSSARYAGWPRSWIRVRWPSGDVVLRVSGT